MHTSAERLTPAIQQDLREMHPDPFVQASIWDLYLNAPGLLDAAPYVTLARTEGLSWDDLVTARKPTTTPKED